MTTDGQLLVEFVQRRSQEAFGQIVRRHMDWIYSCARRQVRDAHLAEDVAQAVFILLAQKARSLTGHGQLNGWLFRATRYCASNAIKQQGRRSKHEKEAGAMQNQTINHDEANWDDVSPALDEAVAGLSAADREAILLRYYQGMNGAELGNAIGVNEEAARKRVQRAVEKLRGAMIKKGVTVSAAALATAVEAKVTTAAPLGLAAAATAASAGVAKGTLTAAIANAASKMMWWVQLKLAATVVLTGGVAAGAGYVIVAQTTATQPVPKNAAVPIAAPPTTVVAKAPATPATEFSPLYEKAPGSGSGMSMKVGPNTFEVAAVVRYGADGKMVAASRPLDDIPVPTGASPNKDIAIVFLVPGRDRYDIDRLRVFDHATRQPLPGYVVTQVPGKSAVQITASGQLPRKIDLWMDVASYGATNLPVSLPAQKDATVVIDGATVGFDEIRDGLWGVNNGKFTAMDQGVNMPETTVRLKATGKWTAGRYQISAISKSGQKYLSNYFIDLGMELNPILTFPFELEKIDHFELRPNAQEPPFYFNGIDLLDGGPRPVSPLQIPEPVIVKAGTESRVELPCGAIMELAGISYSPSTDISWWGLDGQPVAAPNSKTGGKVTDDNGTLRVRELVARMVKSPAGVSGLMWGFSPSRGWAGGGNDRESVVAAAFPAEGPITVRLGVGATPWKTIEEIPVEKLPAEPQCWPGSIEAPVSDPDGVALSVSVINMPSNLRLMLVDKAGKLHFHNGSSSSGSSDKLAPWGLQSTRMTYRGIKVEDIKAVRFETHRVEYAEFEDVPMQPK